MKSSFNQYKLNVYDDFIKRFNFHTKESILLWLKNVMQPHFRLEFDLNNKEVLSLINESAKGTARVIF